MSDPLDIRDNPAKHRFEVEVDGHTAIAEYELGDGVIAFTHTVVPEQLGGRGIGKALVLAGLGAARQRGLKVKPVCSFFAGYMKTHPEEHDLLSAADKAALG
jgi:predicted GNAT family acetyltransferase